MADTQAQTTSESRKRLRPSGEGSDEEDSEVSDSEENSSEDSDSEDDEDTIAKAECKKSVFCLCSLFLQKKWKTVRTLVMS